MTAHKKSVPLTKTGYDSYGVTEGGKAIVTFSDNSDIVTDKEDNAVAITPANLKKEIKFVPRGRNNNMMYDIMKKIGSNVTVGSNIEFKNKVIYGDGIQVYRKYRDKDTGKIIKDEVLESEYPEIFEFLQNNDYDQIRHEMANDLSICYDAYVEIIFNKDDKSPKIVQLKAKEATCSRISTIDDKSFKSEYHGYSSSWNKGTPDDVIATPLLDKQYAILDLKTRMGLSPNKDGVNKCGAERRFIYNVRINTPGRFYYSRPYWWSVFVSGWYDFSSAIPVYKKSLIKNQMTLKYIVYIKLGFFDKLFKNMNITEDDKKAEAKKKFLEDMNSFLCGEENAGKAFVTEFCYDKVKGFEEKDIIITALDNKNIGGEYIEDSEEVSNVICYAMNVHPSIIGASPGKSKSINGTEARELFIIEQALMKIFQDATLKPLYLVKAINNWPKDIYFSIINCQLTTLDKGTGAVKNTGLTPETE